MIVLLAGCPTTPDDDDSAPVDDDDTVATDDDDSGADDDDSVEPCSPDDLEENDDLAVAAEGPESRTRTRHLTVCEPADEDWYRFDLELDDVLTVELFFAHAEGDLDLQLTDPAGNLVAESRSTDDDELAWVQATEAGPVYARVWLAGEEDDTPGVEYDLGTKTCFDDGFEDNDVEADAATLEPPLSLLNLGTCLFGEEDWFVLSGVSAGELLDIRSVFFGPDGDLGLVLYGPDGSVVGQGANAVHVETIVHFAWQDGDYLLRVHVPDDLAGPGLFYDLDVNLGPPPGDCLDDFEPDDTIAEARPITATLYEDFSVCEGDDDHFAFDASAGDEIVFWIDFPHAEGDVDLFLLDDSGAEVASATSLDDDETLLFTALEDGTYVARVTQVTDDGGVLGNLYNLSLEGPTGVGCVPDLWEPNDTPETAPEIPNGDWLDQTICPDDDDWYQLWLNEFELLEVNLGSWHYFEGNADIFLLDEELNVVASSEETFGNEVFFFEVTSSGVYYLWVTLTEDEGEIEGQIYDFGVLSIIQVACSPDFWEPNDRLDQAAYIVPGSLSGATVCIDEPDFFAFDVLDGETVTVDLAFDPAEGELVVDLWDETWAVVASSAPTPDGAAVTAAAASDGMWTVEVRMTADAGETGSAYGLELEVSP